MQWVFYALGTALVMATADICVKLAAGKISNSLALLIYGSCTFTVGLVWVLWQYGAGVQLFAQPAGIRAAIGVGVAFSFVTLGLYATFGAGIPVSIGTPVMRLGGLTIASILGIVLLHEPVSWRYLAGALLAFCGIYLIVTR